MKNITLLAGILVALFASIGSASAAGFDVHFGWGHGGRHPGHGGPAYFACRAQNLRGQVFRAEGFNASNVQWRALNQCDRNSARCRPLGCNRIR